MSFTDSESEPVQPEDGQGGGGTDSPYADYLNRIPEDVRGQVEPIFKDWDANVTRRFQEHADFRRGWEPLQDTGINQFSPEQVQWATQFLGALDSPQTIQQWYEQYAEQNGLTPAQAERQIAQETTLDEFGGLYDQRALEQLLDSRLGPVTQRLEALYEHQSQQEQQVRLHEAQQFVQGQIDEIKSKHPDEWNDEAVEGLISRYIETDPQHAVERAFADWQGILGKLERDFLKQKAGQPNAPEGGGSPVGGAEPIKTLEQASAHAREILRQANRA